MPLDVLVVDTVPMASDTDLYSADRGLLVLGECIRFLCQCFGAVTSSSSIGDFLNIVDDVVVIMVHPIDGRKKKAKEKKNNTPTSCQTSV